MPTLAENLSAVAKANIDAHVQLFSAFASKAFESAEQVFDLNIDLAKASFEESANLAKQALSAKDPQQWLELTTAQTQPSVDKALNYSRQLAEIVSNTHADLTQVAEEQITESSRQVIALVDDLAKNAPAGSENAIALIKTAVGNASAGYEQFSKATKQAVEAIEVNVAAATEQFEKTAQKSTQSRTRKSTKH
jgi:phasin family protein